MTDEQVEAVANAVSDALNLTLTPKGRTTVGRAAIAAYEASQWQSIETAPRDGTNFLVWDSRSGTRIGFCLNRNSHVDWLAYRDADGGSWKGGTRATATHWRPLPTPPGQS